MSPSLYLKQGKIFTVTDKEQLDIHESLPVATYSVGYNSLKDEYYLEKIESFSLPNKLYGDINRLASRIIRTFQDRVESTGVVLSGEKGSGKTLLAKRISVVAAEENVITLVVNEPHCGETFNQFIQMIHQPTIIIFDEFEKVYNEFDHKKKMLTLLDGVYPSKKLFIMTCNDKWELDIHLRNRPGRIYYMLDFSGVDDNFIAEYCEDNLLNKEHIPQINAIAKVFKAFNFDMLKAMVEEMNRYNESPSEVLEFLNARPQYESDANYSVKLFSKQGKIMKVSPDTWYGNPLYSTIIVSHEGKDYSYREVRFTGNELAHVDNESKSYIFVNQQGYRVVLKRDFSGISNFSLGTIGPSPESSGTNGLSDYEFQRMLTTEEEASVSDKNSDGGAESKEENGDEED